MLQEDPYGGWACFIDIGLAASLQGHIFQMGGPDI